MAKRTAFRPLHTQAIVSLFHSIYNVDTYLSIVRAIMDTVIRKWGNSPAVRLPTTVLKAAGYRLEQKVKLVVKRGQIVIQPSTKIEFDLQELVQGITPANSHDEADFGKPVGKEML